MLNQTVKQMRLRLARGLPAPIIAMWAMMSLFLLCEADLLLTALCRDWSTGFVEHSFDAPNDFFDRRTVWDHTDQFALAVQDINID